jgi:tRNA(Ile)-lysidine synthase
VGPPELNAPALDARLDRTSERPLAVAFSGGGDSLALLLAAKAWTDRVERRLVALTVDHRLQPESGKWAAWCADRAARLGVAHRILAWEGPKPATGLAAAARAARHRLIAEAARQAGARVILLGHTADDIVESQVMRAGGVRVSAPREWSPSPVWPEGRELFLLRPLLAARRAELRTWLSAQCETWIEDPANLDLRQPRARARVELAGGGVIAAIEEAPDFAMAAMLGAAGDITLNLAAAYDHPALTSQLGVAVVCAAGAEGPPRRDALDRLATRLWRQEALSSTLGGARVVRTGEWVHVVRETGDARGRRCEAISLPVDDEVIWDGRFQVRATESGLTLAPLAGRAARLGDGARGGLAALHPVARKALPALIDARGAVTCPTLEADPRLTIRNLVPSRWAGATVVADEAGIEMFAL